MTLTLIIIGWIACGAAPLWLSYRRFGYLSEMEELLVLLGPLALVAWGLFMAQVKYAKQPNA